MRKVKNPKVGQLVEVPYYQFAPFRSGWNGWLFRIGVIESLGVNSQGIKVAKVRYATKTTGRGVCACLEDTKVFRLEHIFEYQFLESAKRNYKEYREDEKRGEQVLWGETTAFLVQNGFIERID